MNALSRLSAPVSDAPSSETQSAAASASSNSENGFPEAESFFRHVSELATALSPDEETVLLALPHIEDSIDPASALAMILGGAIEGPLAARQAQPGLQQIAAEARAKIMPNPDKILQTELTAINEAELMQAGHDLLDSIQPLLGADSEQPQNAVRAIISGETMVPASLITLDQNAQIAQPLQLGAAELVAQSSRLGLTEPQTPITGGQPAGLNLGTNSTLSLAELTQSSGQPNAALPGQVLNALNAPAIQNGTLPGQISSNGLPVQSALENHGQTLLRPNFLEQQIQPGQVGETAGGQSPLTAKAQLSLREQNQLTPDQYKLSLDAQAEQIAEKLPHPNSDITAEIQPSEPLPDTKLAARSEQPSTNISAAVRTSQLAPVVTAAAVPSSELASAVTAAGLPARQFADKTLQNQSQYLQPAAIERSGTIKSERLETPGPVAGPLQAGPESITANIPANITAIPNISGPFANPEFQPGQLPLYPSSLDLSSLPASQLSTLLSSELSPQLASQLALGGLHMAPTPLGSLAGSVTPQGSAQPLSAANLSSLGQGLVRAAKSNKGVAVQLDPPELGRVYIDFQFESGRGVTAIIRPEFADTSQLLQDQSNWLGQTLSASGFDKVNIQFAAPDNQGFAFTGRDHPAGAQPQSEYEPGEQSEPSAQSASAGILDTMVHYAKTSGGPLNIKL